MRAAIISALLLALSPGQALAQERNGTVCDVLEAPGVTQGLLPLCEKYCKKEIRCPASSAGAKAMSRRCKPPKQKWLDQYNALRTPTDPPMPCVKSPECPCWTQDEIASIGRNNWLPHLLESFVDMDEFSTQLALVENRLATDTFPFGAFELAEVVFFSASGHECHYFNSDFAPGAPEEIIRVQSISEEDAAICQASIEEQIGALAADGIEVSCSGNGC